MRVHGSSFVSAARRKKGAGKAAIRRKGRLRMQWNRSFSGISWTEGSIPRGRAMLHRPINRSANQYKKSGESKQMALPFGTQNPRNRCASSGDNDNEETFMNWRFRFALVLGLASATAASAATELVIATVNNRQMIEMQKLTPFF